MLLIASCCRFLALFTTPCSNTCDDAFPSTGASNSPTFVDISLAASNACASDKAKCNWSAFNPLYESDDCCCDNADAIMNTLLSMKLPTMDIPAPPPATSTVTASSCSSVLSAPNPTKAACKAPQQLLTPATFACTPLSPATARFLQWLADSAMCAVLPAKATKAHSSKPSAPSFQTATASSAARSSSSSSTQAKPDSYLRAGSGRAASPPPKTMAKTATSKAREQREVCQQVPSYMRATATSDAKCSKA